MKTLMQQSAIVALAAAGLAVSAAQADPGARTPQWTWTEATPIVEAAPPLPPTSIFPVQLVLDDDTADGSFGVATQTARQFLWFNRFSPPAGFHLEEVWVLFPSGSNMAAGGAVQIAIYEDPDGDPSNGATLVQSFDTTIQVADGNTFSIYPLPASVLIPGGSELFVGVVPRFIVSGVTSPTTPAALDTTTSQARSWLAVWSADPPDPPALLPLPDQSYVLVDAFVPGGGNWMIRAFGSEQGITEIPTLGEWGLAALALALLAAGVVLLRRRCRCGVGAALALALLALAAPAGAVTIDDFNVNMPALLSAPPQQSSNTANAAILGGNRGVVLDNLSGSGPTTVNVTGGNLVFTVTATTPDSRGEARLSWDADTNPLVLSTGGFNPGVDLTAGNTSGFQIGFTSSTVAAEIEITVHDDNVVANSSRAVRRVAVGGAQLVRIPFSEFRTSGSAPANFADVRAVELTIRAGEGTFSINEFITSPPALAATKVDQQVLDVDGDTRVDPGDRVRYTVTVTNTGNEALAVDLSDTVDANTTLVAASVSSTPVAHNDQYGWFGNVTFATDGSATKPDLLDNDQDADGDTLTVQSGTFPATTAQGGTLTLISAATGEFTYSPPAGFAGVDSFNYTILDDNGNTSTATANITLDGVIWFVDDSNTTPPHLGTLADPFQTLASVNSGSDPDQPGDTIFVFDDDGTAYAGGLVLEADQTLLGEAAGLILDGTTIVPVGGRPQITNAAGVGLSLSTNNTLGGFDIQNTSGAGIFGSAFGTLTATNVNVLTTGGATLDLTTGALSSVVFGTLSSTGAGGQRGLNLATLTGSLTATTTSLTNPTTDGILVSGSAGASFSFGATTVTDNAIGSGATGDGVDVATGNAGATFNFASLAVTSDAGAGLRASSSGTINLSGTGNSIVSTGGAAVDVTSTSFGSGVTFATLTSTNSTGKGVNLDTVTGSFTANGGSISGATVGCFDVNAGSGNITYTGNITCPVGRIVDITARTGGTIALSGNLSATGSGSGINVASNSGGTVNFSGTSKSLGTTTGAAVTLATNTGATINFTGGGLAITTTSGSGFNATGGATAITVQGAGNTIASTTGTPLNVANSAIGASGLTFQSIAANGAASGISLNTTGSSGGLTVTGTGTTDGSGGTIQNTSGRGAAFISTAAISLSNMNFTSAGTSDLDADNSGLSTGDNLATNAAIHLQTVTGATLTNLNITGGAEQGINGNAVSNFALSNSSIVDVGNGPDEDGIHFFNMSGTSSITNNTFTCTVATHNTTGGDDHINLQMQSGTLNLTISGGSANNANKGSGYLMGIRGTASATVTVDGVTSDNNFSGGIVIDTFDTATSVIEIKNSSSINNNDAISLSSNNGNTKFDIHDNVSFAGTDFVRINILKAAFSTTGTLEGKIRNNPIVVTDGQAADGIIVAQRGDGTLTVSITNNTFTYRGTQRPINILGGQDGSGQLNATVTGNSIDMQLDGTGNAVTGIFAQTAVASPSGDNTNMCADIGGAGGLRNVFTHSMGGNMVAGEIRVRQRFVTTVTLPGYGGANNDDAAVVTYLAGRNTLVNVPSATATNEVGVTVGAGGFVNAASCPQPVFP